MIRIECFVEDKHLAKVIHLLAGQVMNLNVSPVVNATVDKGKVVAAGERQPGYIRVFERLKRNGKAAGHRVASVEIKEAMTDEKLSANAYSGMAMAMKEAGMLKPVQRGMFTLQEPKA